MTDDLDSTVRVVVSQEIEQVCPEFIGACVDARVINSPYCQELWDEIGRYCEKFRSELTTESLKEISSISATRRVYKACGKDPSRYRPASEALIRRVLQGKQLYQLNTLVDLVNLASIVYGYSIGGFDAERFVGDTLTLGIGRQGEPYEGIGRGFLNIEGLPVYRDTQGGVARLPATTSGRRLRQRPAIWWYLSTVMTAMNSASDRMLSTYKPCCADTARVMAAHIIYIGSRKCHHLRLPVIAGFMKP